MVWKGEVSAFRLLEGVLLALAALGFVKFWARTRFWLPRYVHVLAGFALAVSMWGVSAAPVDAPMNKHGPIVRLLFALVVPAMVYFFFVLHGGQRAAFDRSFSRLVPCPSCQNSVKSLPPEAGCTTTTTHFAEPECPHCGHELS